MKSTILLTVSLLAGSALASLPLGLRPRQEGSCADEEMKDCGAGCIPFTYTCCPDGSGGCPTTAVCVLADNGEYGCCPLGEECSGPGGATTLPGGTYTSTIEGSPTPSSSESFGSLTFASTPSVTTPSMTPVSTSTPFESVSTPSASTPSASTPSMSTPSMSSASSPTPASTTTTTSSAVAVAAAAPTDFAGAAVFGGAMALAVALL